MSTSGQWSVSAMDEPDTTPASISPATRIACVLQETLVWIQAHTSDVKCRLQRAATDLNNAISDTANVL